MKTKTTCLFYMFYTVCMHAICKRKNNTDYVYLPYGLFESGRFEKT